ncbi:MAG: molybdate ABC transporter substrate-binding protein [Lachnospiraceae bacterium]|nr:molybdate ABC transporter substrate-binding protein [Lachnospiraceae bacterium]
MCGQVIYPAAVLNISQHQAEAQAFLDYLTTPEASAVFEAVGFTALSNQGASGENVELIVFAAASMTETLTQIESMYEAANENIDLVFTFDSSGTLKTQIQEGADCDLFISAAPKQMNQLDITAPADVNTEGLDFVLQGSRINLLENKVALCVAEGNPANINSYDDLINALKDENSTILLAMGNADVPVGQYTQKIFTFFGIDEAAIASKLTYGSNVKEVTTAVSEATADCGIIYATDAFSAGLTPVDTATAEMCGQVIYPAAVLNISQHQAEAQAFLDYLTTPEASAVFEAVGFTALNK